MNLFVIVRFLLALVFIVSGANKIIEPLSKFLYVIQSYEVTPVPIDFLAALFFPWLEFLFGVFLALGLWLKFTTRALWAFITFFILLIGQALWRGLPISECGCFGDFVVFPLHVTLMFDLGLWILFVFLIHFSAKTSSLSLDHYFEKNKTLEIRWPF